MTDAITVMATRQGVYDHFREEGDVFEIRKEGDFSKFWMVKVSDAEALKLQKAAQKQPEAERHVVDTTVVDNAELEALRAQLAERNAEIERLTRNNPGKAAKTDDKNAGGEKSAAEVLKMANDPSVEFMTFKAAAKKVLGDATPSTKAEIIAALEDKATAP
ncbi:hypothetical protein [Agrobacterium cavarae]|uniref:hypothetical protein n=1 Tax=Agrobacterium cavarae TaxID=2528239 RepID=UPI0028A0EA7F|nr:hypothetical protein [Agrobacterium cavarae]